jgi:tRNA 2-selenouridine synthase SelU
MAEKKEAQQQTITKQKAPPTEDDIRKRAYEIYCARGGEPGDEVDDWLKAEAELKEGRATAE